MLYDVRFWFTLAALERSADIACRIDASSVEEAALFALRLYRLASVAYAAVSLVSETVVGTVFRAWGPIDQASLQVEGEVLYG